MNEKLKLPTWYLVSQGYYLCYNSKADDKFDPRNPKFPTKLSTGVYIVSDRDIGLLRHATSLHDYTKSGSQIYRLIHKGSQSSTYASRTHGHVEVRNLTKGELDQLIDAKPSWDAIKKSYEWTTSFVGPIWFDFNNPILVF
jgi:hypothetical protein